MLREVLNVTRSASAAGCRDPAQAPRALEHAERRDHRLGDRPRRQVTLEQVAAHPVDVVDRDLVQRQRAALRAQRLDVLGGHRRSRAAAPELRQDVVVGEVAVVAHRGRLQALFDLAVAQPLVDRLAERAPVVVRLRGGLLAR
jgi:hypothetical protein